MEVVRKYLERYAEPDARLAWPCDRPFSRCIVIPAYAEGRDLAGTLDSIPCQADRNTLLVVVINEPPDADDEHRWQNHETLEWLGDRYRDERGEQTSGVESHWWADTSFGRFVCIDKTGERALAKDEGVGLARKIGCDVALAMAATGLPTTRLRWIHTTDADAILPTDYFDAADRVDGAAALVYPFVHVPDSDEDVAALDSAREYERFLDSYVEGLSFAGSSYAFHTIGSCIAVTPAAYASVRGFPKRSAGEDFHFLNKVRKVGTVVVADSDSILLSARRSMRTLFGTGQALDRLDQSSESGRVQPYLPRTFELLRLVLEVLPVSTCTEDLLAGLSATVNAAELEIIASGLELVEIEKGFVHANTHSRTDAARVKHLHNYLDALQTLRWVRHVDAALKESVEPPLS